VTGQRIARIALIAAALCLSGCTTVKMPDLSFAKLKGFFAENDEIDDYPKVADAPAIPTDIRSDAAWDEGAKNLLKLRDEFKALENDGVAKSDAEIERDLEALRAKVRAYKADDPPYPQ